MSQGPEIVVTVHARRRADERYGHEVAHNLEAIARHAVRIPITRDQLWFWRGEHRGRRVFMLCAEKRGSLLGLFGLEVVTVLTPEQAATHGVT